MRIFQNTRRAAKSTHRLSKTAREHIIIFHDKAKTVQVWQWVKREAGKASECREQLFYKGQSGDALTQKILGIAFSLEDEANVAEAVARVGAAFDVEKVTKKFYDLFKKEHDAFLKFVKGIPDEDLKKMVCLGDAQPPDVHLFHSEEGFSWAAICITSRTSWMKASGAARTSSTAISLPAVLRGLCQARRAAQRRNEPFVGQRAVSERRPVSEAPD